MNADKNPRLDIGAATEQPATAMTMRDHFAASIVGGMLAVWGAKFDRDDAAKAYEIADWMLAARDGAAKR